MLCTICVLLFSCKKTVVFDQKPEIEPLRHGINISAAVGYCASIASSAFKGEPLPGNVIFQHINHNEYSSAGLLFVKIDEQFPLPFNNQIGEITIAGIWDENNRGVITVIFTNFNVLSSNFEFYGLYTVPVMKQEDGTILTLFAEQDIIIGEGSDTLLNLNLSNPQFNMELERLNSERPKDVFAAIKQNVWFVTIDPKNTFSDVYDDVYTINGGGQIVKVNGITGGVLYHALIQTEFDYYTCQKNPVRGKALIQNIEVGSIIDLGTLLLDFHETCDGNARVTLASGKYLNAYGDNIDLELN